MKQVSEMKHEFEKAARLTHIALHVKDIDLSSDFYQQWCGMNEVDRRVSDRTGTTVVWLACQGQEDDFVIVLIDGADDEQVETGRERMRHIGFSLPERSDVQAMAEKAKESGILHWDYKDFPFPVGTLCAVSDPDGHIVEFSYGQPLGPDFRAQNQVDNPKQQP